MTQEEMDALTGDTTNKSEKIRRLHGAGVPAADIGRYLTISYQHVYNVLLRAGVITKGESKSTSATVTEAGDTIVLSLEAGGVVRLPAAVLAAQGLSDGDRLICRTSAEGLMIMSRKRALDHLREVARSRMPEEADLFEALLGGG